MSAFRPLRSVSGQLWQTWMPPSPRRVQQITLAVEPARRGLEAAVSDYAKRASL